MEKIIIILAIVILAFEFFEHLAFPLFWSLFHRKKKSCFGPERIINEVGEVREWQGTEGYVFIAGELWKAVSDRPLETGNKVIAKRIENLTLMVDLSEMKELSVNRS